MTRFYNWSALTLRRKDLRNNATYAEQLLWDKLKHSKLSGIKFRRQNSVGNYILDFYAPELKLCVELDGAQHEKEENKEHDLRRAKYLSSFNIKIIRFKNAEVIYNIEKVLEEIRGFAEEIKTRS